MRINIYLDKEEPLNPSEPLANIELVGDDRNSILDTDIWADDWLIALMEGAQALERGEADHSAAIITEPYALAFRISKHRITITYNQSRIKVESQPQFQHELKVVIRTVIEAFGPKVIFQPGSFWKQLQEYADR